MTSKEWYLVMKVLKELSSHAACSQEMRQAINNHALGFMMAVDHE